MSILNSFREHPMYVAAAAQILILSAGDQTLSMVENEIVRSGSHSPTART